MDKTYAETMGHPPFDWNQFLANPPAKESEPHNVAAMRANSWVTCACGNQCAIVPRHKKGNYPIMLGEPVDRELSALGYRFVNDINSADWPAARVTLAAIEARSAVLIRAELAKLNAP